MVAYIKNERSGFHNDLLLLFFHDIDINAILSIL
jgi:hypothetical protein